MNEDLLVEKLKVVIHEEVQKETRKVVQEELEPIKETLGRHEEILNEHTRILEEHTRILEEHGRILEQHSKKLDRHENLYTAIYHCVLGMEQDFGNKLSALFDYFIVSEEKNDEQDKKINIHSNKLENYSIRIANLEDSTK